MKTFRKIIALNDPQSIRNLVKKFFVKYSEETVLLKSLLFLICPTNCLCFCLVVTSKQDYNNK